MDIPAASNYGERGTLEPASMTPEETQLAAFFAAYAPPIAEFGLAVRAKLRARLPGLSEIVYVYENQGSLVIAYSPSAQGYEGVCSLAVYPDRVSLYFTQGAQLAKADPQKLLQGRTKTVRFVAVGAAADLARPEVEALMAAALTLAGVRVDPGANGALILKAESQKQRARRAAKTAPPDAAPTRE